MAVIIDPIVPPAAETGSAEHIPISVSAVTGAGTATVGVLQIADVIDGELAGAINLALTAWIGAGAAWITARVTARRRV